MTVVWTIKEKCERCYTCIRECPAKAIKVEKGQAMVIPERCVGCGHCYTVCTQGAKEILDGIAQTSLFLNSARTGSLELVAMVAPSFPAVYPEISYKKLVGSLKELGFTAVVEVAFGADLVNVLYKKAVDENDITLGKRPLIGSSCPAIVEYVEKFMPELKDNLAKIVSPMAATGKMIKEKYGSDAKTVFIGPCIAKKKERSRSEVEPFIDEVITFEELDVLLNNENISILNSKESEYDPPKASLGRLYPVSGGLIKSSGMTFDLLDNNIIVSEGKHRVKKLLELVRDKEISTDFIDVLFCEGCINGPAVRSDANYFSRKQRVVEYINEDRKNFNIDEWEKSINEYSKLDYTAEFLNRDQRLPDPSTEEIHNIFNRINKFKSKDELNCGACGYETCKDYAIAIHKGLAEEEMCLPFLIDKQEKTYKELQNSLQELHDTQEQLIHSEKLASVGQLAAGVAHEVNNPLGSIILYSHLLLKQLPKENDGNNDIKMIVEEATRCKNIVSGLLDFARQGKLTLHKENFNNTILKVIDKLLINEKFNDVSIKKELSEQSLVFLFDSEQMTQVLLNLFNNSADALNGSEKTIIIKTFLDEEAKTVNLHFEDNGEGIPKENMGKLFTPFFTTKATGKGTGLGLPIVYGIIKMHNGQINVDSEKNKGTKIRIKIPYLQEEPKEKKQLLF